MEMFFLKYTCPERSFSVLEFYGWRRNSNFNCYIRLVLPSTPKSLKGKCVYVYISAFQLTLLLLLWRYLCLPFCSWSQFRFVVLDQIFNILVCNITSNKSSNSRITSSIFLPLISFRQNFILLQSFAQILFPCRLMREKFWRKAVPRSVRL